MLKRPHTHYPTRNQRQALKDYLDGINSENKQAAFFNYITQGPDTMPTIFDGFTDEYFQKLPRGIRNNNPGNVRYNSVNKFLGCIGADQDGFAVCTHMFFGVRMMTLILRHYIEHDNCHTLRQVITRWAPPTENATENYIEYVCHHLNKAPDDTITITDIAQPLVDTIIHYECGVILSPYSIVTNAVLSALTSDTSSPAPHSA